MNKVKGIELFLKYVIKTETCWLWTGAKRGAYGCFFYGKLKKSNRVAYELFIGEIEDNLKVRHTCDNPVCVNPDHLKLGSHQDNMDDMVNRKRSASGARHGSITHPECVPKGDKHGFNVHPEKRPKGEKHGMAKLTKEKVKQLRKECSEGKTQRQAANEYNVSQATVNDIVNYKIWKEKKDANT